MYKEDHRYTKRLYYYSREYFNDQGFYGASGKGVRWI